MNNNDLNNRINQLELLMFDSERDGDSIVFDVQALKAKEAELLKRALSIHSDKVSKRRHQRREFISILSSAACIMLIIAATFVFALKGPYDPSLNSEQAISVALNTPPPKLPPLGSTANNHPNMPPDDGKNCLESQGALNVPNEPQEDFNTWDKEDPCPTSMPEYMDQIEHGKNETILAEAILSEAAFELSNSKVTGAEEELSFYISRDYSLTSKIRTNVSPESASLSYHYRLDEGYANITYHYILSDDPKAASSKVPIPESKPKFVELSGGERVAVYNVYKNNKLDHILAVFTKDAYAMTVSFNGVSNDAAIAFLKSLTALSMR